MLKIGRMLATVTVLIFLVSCAGTNFVKPEPESLSLNKATYHDIIAQYGEPFQQGSKLKNDNMIRTATYAYSSAGGTALHEGVTPARGIAFHFSNGVLVGFEFSSSYQEDHSDFDDSKISLLKKGTTTRSQVESLLGEASGRYVFPLVKSREAEALVYVYSQFKDFKFYQKMLVVTVSNDRVSDVEFTMSGERQTVQTPQKSKAIAPKTAPKPAPKLAPKPASSRVSAKVQKSKTEIQPKKEVAVPTTKPSQPTSDSPLKLAVLPWKLYCAPELKLSDDYFLSIAIDAVRDFMKDTPLSSPVYSYYPLGRSVKTRTIKSSILGSAKKRRLWIKNGVFSQPSPNTKLMTEIGKQLNVDAVLVYYIRVESGVDDIKAYLIDVNKNWAHRVAGQCDSFNNSEGYDTIYRLTEDVFAQF